MSKLIDKLRERVEAEVAPLRKYMGDDAPPVRMALMILSAVEEIERELGEERVSTKRAAEITGWDLATLQKYAKMKCAGEELPGPWAGLDVESTASGYEFTVGSIPRKKAA